MSEGRCRSVETGEYCVIEYKTNLGARTMSQCDKVMGLNPSTPPFQSWIFQAGCNGAYAASAVQAQSALMWGGVLYPAWNPFIYVEIQGMSGLGVGNGEEIRNRKGRNWNKYPCKLPIWFGLRRERAWLPLSSVCWTQKRERKGNPSQ